LQLIKLEDSKARPGEVSSIPEMFRSSEAREVESANLVIYERGAGVFRETAKFPLHLIISTGL
jgi:hypothetical protein